MMSLIPVLGSLAVVGSLFVAWWAVSGERTPSVELGSRTRSEPDLRARMLDQRASDRIANNMLEQLGEWVRRRTPGGRLAELRGRIAQAGSPPGWTVERILAAKVLLAVIFGVLVMLAVVSEPSMTGVLLVLAAAAIGFIAPNVILTRRADQRREAIRRELPDVIDQLTLMVQAGLGIDAAIARAARSSHGALAQELTRVGHDIRVGVDRAVALTHLAERIDLPDLNAFVGALTQAEQLGVPISRTLEIQAHEFRLKRRQHAEEQAMKLPVKLLFPLVLCILPVLLMVILAPAAIRIFEQFS